MAKKFAVAIAIMASVVNGIFLHQSVTINEGKDKVIILDLEAVRVPNHPHHLSAEELFKRGNISLVDMKTGVEKPPLVIDPFDIENEDSQDFNEASQQDGMIQSQSHQDYFPLGADARPVKDVEENGPIYIPLYHVKDVEYLASVFIGTPVGQRARVVFDSGSNWLTVKGCIT